MTSARTLTDMPKVVLKNILEQADYRTILVLRKVCHSLRDYIDDLNPDPKLSEVHVKLDYKSGCPRPNNFSKWIQFYFISTGDNRQHSIKYGRSQEGCMITYQGKTRKWMKNEYYVDVFLRDIEYIWRYQKSGLKKIVVTGHLEEADVVVNNMKDLLESRKSLIRTEELYLHTHNASHSFQMLQLLNPKTLKKIVIPEMMWTGKLFEISELVVLEHWKNAEKIRLLKTISSESLPNFCHCLEGQVTVDRVPSAEIMVVMREAFRHSKFKRFQFDYECAEGDKDFWSSMGQQESLSGSWPKWNYSIPNSDDVLVIFQNLGWAEIKFEKKKRRHINPNAIINPNLVGRID